MVAFAGHRPILCGLSVLHHGNQKPCRLTASCIIPAVRFDLEYEITLPEFLEMAWRRHRSSVRWIIGISLSMFGLLLGAFFYVYADPGFGLFLAAMSVLLLLMLLVVSSIAFRRGYRRNPRIFGKRKVTISETGIVSDSQLAHVETNWNTYQQFRETKNLFLLYQSKDLIRILPKRVFTNPEDLENVRGLIASKIQKA